MVFWMLTIAVSVSLLVITAAARSGDVQWAYVHMLISALVAICFALIAIREHRQMEAAGASDGELAAAQSRFMGLVWAWGALALVVTYGTGVLSWKEWPGFFAAFAVASGLAFFMSFRITASESDGAADPGLLKIARYLGWAQLVGMVIVMLGLLIDGKMVRFYTLRYTDWAANNYFFFGALALAAISAYGLRSARDNGSKGGDA